ncbi:porin [Roseateles sp. DAIF2]|uniref:porin n=1 Tax=Roseateles sp. DAIF2 TaxID=2714952 RepID=UPI0018A305A6|nr:porin [Roseateles sp. DAIF2]QPF72778.1 porin [Roseateles sp. DAIF2]
MRGIKTIITPSACALGALALLAGSAWAQSGSQVTLSGIADAAVRHVKNEGRGGVSSLVSGGNSTSRIIIRGSEDLGGGLSAGFHLEHGILLDSGTQASGTMFWDRRATVSLVSKQFGELRAGRDFVPSYSNWSRYDPFSYVGVAGANIFVSATPQGPLRAAFGSGANSTVRSSNALQWLLPAGLGGIEGGLMLAAGEGGTAANGQHKLAGARVGYANKSFNIAAAYTRSENNLTGSDALDDWALGGSYNFGPLRASLAWRQFKLGAAKQTQTLLGAWVPLGPGQLKLSWNRVDLQGRVGNTAIDRNDADQLGLGYVYDLSKRSALYATVARVANKGGASYAVPGGASGMAGGGDSTGVELGMRHNF